jgi:hypothetical protein
MANVCQSERGKRVEEKLALRLPDRLQSNDAALPPIQDGS